MKTILSVCKKVLTITDEEFARADEVAREQLEYTHPLKMATTGKQRALGDHNTRVLAKLRELRDVIREGAGLAK